MTVKSKKNVGKPLGQYERFDDILIEALVERFTQIVIDAETPLLTVDMLRVDGPTTLKDLVQTCPKFPGT